MMDIQLLYQQDVSVLDFEAQVVEVLSLDRNRTGVVLDRTYFYPTSGGQEHDTGTIGTARVVDVFKDEGHSRLVHVVEGVVGLGLVQARIDAERRLRHMQHHTAQHLLTQCILRQTGFETVSANINGYSPSTLDIVSTQVEKTDLDAAEQQANKIVYDNIDVKIYIVSPEELKAIPLRRPPKVNENIRIVEIDGFDYSPCGGTHVLQTGSIGVIKVLKAERMNDKMRIYFVAGTQAMELFSGMYDTLTGMAIKMSTAWQDIPEVVNKQAEQLSAAQKELQAFRLSGLRYEAADLLSKAIDRDGVRWVKATFESRQVNELRMLGEELKKSGNVVAFLSSYDGQKVSLVVICGESTGRDARQLLSTALSPLNGRGGGDGRLAQGGGTATQEQYPSFLEHLANVLVKE